MLYTAVCCVHDHQRVLIVNRVVRCIPCPQRCGLVEGSRTGPFWANATSSAHNSDILPVTDMSHITDLYCRLHSSATVRVISSTEVTGVYTKLNNKSALRFTCSTTITNHTSIHEYFALYCSSHSDVLSCVACIYLHNSINIIMEDNAASTTRLKSLLGTVLYGVLQ